MAVELETYIVECEHCGKDTSFLVWEVMGLSMDIEYEVVEACARTERDVEAQFAGMIDPDDHPIQPRMMWELAAAIRRGDTSEAEILLDRIAYELGTECSEAVQQGRFSREARP